MPKKKTDYSKESDTDLYRRLGKNDEGAFMELFRRHGSRAVEYATRIMGGDPARGEDIAQMVWENAVRIAPRQPEVKHFRAWLLTLVRHTAYRALKASSNKNEILESKTADEGGSLEMQVADHFSIEEDLVRRVEVKRLYELIDELPDVQRVAILGWMVEDVSQAELAESLGVTYTALGVLIFRAKKTLEKRLREELQQELSG